MDEEESSIVGERKAGRNYRVFEHQDRIIDSFCCWKWVQGMTVYGL